VSSFLSDPGLDSIWVHRHLKYSSAVASLPRSRSISSVPSFSTVCEFYTCVLVLTVEVVFVVVTSDHPLNSWLLYHCTEDASVNGPTTDLIAFESNVVTFVINIQILTDWNMNEKKAFALATVLNLKVLLSEPLYLFWPHTTIPINA